MLGHLQISQLQLLQDEQQAQHQRQKGLLEEQIVRLRQALHQSNRNLELSSNGAEVQSREFVVLHASFCLQCLGQILAMC